MGDGLFGVLVVLGLVVTVGLFVAGFWVQKKRHERFRAWALRNRWTYAESERALVDISRGQPFGQGSSRRAIEVLRGTYDSRPALSFTYQWTTGSGKNRTTHHAHIVGLALPTYLPTVEVTPEGLGARLAKLVGAQDVQFESEAFNRAYRVAATDQRTGHAILHPRLMERLLRATPSAPPGGSTAPGSCRGSPGPPTSTAWRPGSACSPPSSGPSRGTSGRTTATTPPRPRSVSLTADAGPTLRSPEPPDLREALL